MSGSGLDSIGIGKLPDFTPPPVKPDMKDSASTVNNGSVKAEHVPDFQHTALLFGDRSEASGNGGGVKAIVDILATIGIISAEVARNLWQAITETDGNGVSSSRPDGPDIPWAEPGEDEVRIRNGDTGMDEVIFERGPIEPAGNSEDETDIGDGGDNNIPKDPKVGTGGNDDDDDEPDWMNNSDEAAQNQLNWAARVIAAIKIGTMVEGDVRELVATIDELGDRIDPANRIAIITEAVKSLAGVTESASDGSEYSRIFNSGADQLLEALDLDPALKTDMELALGAFIEAAFPKNRDPAIVVAAVQMLKANPEWMKTFELVLMDTVNGQSGAGEDGFDDIQILQNEFLADRHLGDALEQFRQADGSLVVDGKSIPLFTSPTEHFLLKAAALKQFRSNATEDVIITEATHLMKAAILDADSKRTEIGLDLKNDQAKQQIMSDFPELGPGTQVSVVSSNRVDEDVLATLEYFFEPLNETGMGLAPANFGAQVYVPAVVTNRVTGQKAFVVMDLDAAQVLTTMKDKIAEPAGRVDFLSQNNERWEFVKGDYSIEIILPMFGIGPEKMSDLEPPIGVAPLPDWVPVTQ